MDQTFFHSLDNLMHQIKTLVKFIGHFFLDKIIGNSNSNSTLSRFFGQHCYHATSILLILRYVEGYSNQNFFTIKYYTDVCSSLFHLILSPFLVARSR